MSDHGLRVLLSAIQSLHPGANVTADSVRHEFDIVSHANVVGAQGVDRYDGGTRTAPGVASTNTEGLTTDCSGVEMATADATPPSGALAARLDGCPTACGNAEVPYGQFEPPSGGVVALYECADCGHRWHTSWLKESAA